MQTSNDLSKKEKIFQQLSDYFTQKSTVYHIEIVFLYGSWAKGYPRRDSDIDLAISAFRSDHL